MDSHPAPENSTRLQRLDKVSLLSQCPLFSGLSQWELKSISQLMRLVEFKKDEIIYREGCDAGSFYVVVSGRLEAYTSALEKKKVLAYFRRGDFFGEMSLLTQEPHSATMHAISDSLILELKKEDFQKTFENNASVSLELSRRLSRRLQPKESHTRLLLKSDVVGIYGYQKNSARDSFALNLAASLAKETGQKTILVDISRSDMMPGYLSGIKKVIASDMGSIESMPDNAFADSIASHEGGFSILSIVRKEGDRSEDMITPLLNYLAISHRFILINLSGSIDATIMKALAQSDSLFFISDSHINSLDEIREVAEDIQKNFSFANDKVSFVIHEAYLGMRTTPTAKRAMFGERLSYALPVVSDVAGILDEEKTLILLNNPDCEFSRIIRHIARRLSNNLVGLCLGSGAALGLAHVGVLKVLERERIPIDIVSGASIGSLIASFYAIGKTADEIESAALEINSTAKLLKLMDINWNPTQGLLDGRLVMQHFKKHLGDKTFDDCRIPLKIIGSNISMRQAMVIDSGYISDAVRLSISIPAIFKPIVVDGDLMVDGGILSPLPVRALHQAGANKVIAVDVFPDDKDMRERKIILRERKEQVRQLVRRQNIFKRTVYKLKTFAGKVFNPNFVDILMTTIQMMESEIAAMEGESADVLLRPTLPTASWVEFYHADRFIKRGEEECEKMLPKIKQLVSQQSV